MAAGALAVESCRLSADTRWPERLRRVPCHQAPRNSLPSATAGSSLEATSSGTSRSASEAAAATRFSVMGRHVPACLSPPPGDSEFLG